MMSANGTGTGDTGDDTGDDSYFDSQELETVIVTAVNTGTGDTWDTGWAHSYDTRPTTTDPEPPYNCNCGGGGGSNSAPETVVNLVTDPCKNGALTAITNNKIRNTISQFYNDYLVPASSNFRIVLLEGPVVSGGPAETVSVPIFRSIQN